jgi:bacterioferritin (cytochrome b1)
VRERGPLVWLTAAEILAGLSAALEAEEQAAADYQAHAQATDQTAIREALETLCDVEREHALRLAQRIRALGGKPASLAPKIRAPGDNLAGWLAQDLEGEQWAIVEYARLVAGAVDDDETAELMAELLWDEIKHARWLKSTLRALEGEAGSSE